jgi:hypothetical protein
MMSKLDLAPGAGAVAGTCAAGTAIVDVAVGAIDPDGSMR